MNHLKTKGILAVFHYIPLHLSQVARSMGYSEGQLPITESLSKRLLRLPLYYDLEHEQQEEVVDAIKEFFSGKELSLPRYGDTR